MLKRTLVAAAMLIYLCCSSQARAQQLDIAATIELVTPTDTLMIDGQSFDLSLDLAGSTVAAFGGPFTTAEGNSIDIAFGGTSLGAPTGPGATSTGGLLINEGANQGLIIAFPATTAAFEFDFNGNDIVLFSSFIELDGFVSPGVGGTVTQASIDASTIGLTGGNNDVIIRFTDAAGVDTDYTLNFDVASVPEPSSFLALGLTGMFFVRRRKR